MIVLFSTHGDRMNILITGHTSGIGESLLEIFKSELSNLIVFGNFIFQINII